MPGEKPTHRMCVVRDNSETGKRERFIQVGAGWVNSKGQIRFVFNPGVNLRWDDGLTIWAFENKDNRTDKPNEKPNE